jgi:hypothetical protein
VVLTDAEAESLVEACALFVLAVQADARVSLPEQMGTVLCELFEGLKNPVRDNPAIPIKID